MRCSQDGSSLQHVSQGSTQIEVEQIEPAPMLLVALAQSRVAQECARELADSLLGAQHMLLLRGEKHLELDRAARLAIMFGRLGWRFRSHSHMAAYCI